MTAFFRKLLSPVVELREREFGTAMMMFTYSFLVMTAYTALKPVTRSQFIKDLGADNLPFVQFAFGLLVGFIMQGYATVVGRLPRRWALPMTLGGLVALLVAFWVWFESGSQWASTGFYFFGLILGILVISQFWTLANEVYDPRQAKRIFGFIGGGASLGGIAGSSLTLQAKTIGTTNLLLVSAALIALCLVLVVMIIKREKPEIKGSLTGGEDESVSSTEALRLLKNSRHLQIIALIIGFAAIGAAIVEQQLNMATEAAKGAGNTDSITSFLGTVQLYTSMIGFVIQVWLTSKIQRYLGIGFALLILPTSLGITGTIMLLNGALVLSGACARHRHVASLHRRQDDARDPLPAAAERSEAAGQAVHRRHGRSLLEGHRRAARAVPHQGSDLWLPHRARPELAAAQLGEPGDDRPLGGGHDSRAPRVPA